MVNFRRFCEHATLFLEVVDSHWCSWMMGYQESHTILTCHQGMLLDQQSHPVFFGGSPPQIFSLC